MNIIAKKQRIKVAIVLMHFNYGGAERMVSLLASHLDLARFDVRVICIYGNPQDNVMERMVLEHGVPIVFIRKGLGFSFKHLLKVWNELSSFGPDVVHTHLNACMYCAPWVMMHRVKMLHTIHNVPEREASSWLRRSLMGALYHCGKAVPVAISEENRRLSAKFYGLPERRVEMVVNPVDVRAFGESSEKSYSERSYDFINVARFEQQKNHEALIKAFSILVKEKGYPKAKLALVGEGPLREKMKCYTDELGLKNNVDFLGRRDDVAKLMHDSRCFILPSLYEGLPMTMLEAMAAGLPVVVTSVGGAPDVVDGNGLIVNPEDIDSIAEAMQCMIENADAAASMAEKSSSIIQRYDVKTVAEQYEAKYEAYSK